MKLNYLPIFLFCTLLIIGCKRPNLIIYDAPEQEKKSETFELFVNDQSVFVYQARVSKSPINQIWPGYQRPLDQTELSSFSYFDFEGIVKVRINSVKEINSVRVLPQEFGIIPRVQGNTIEFELDRPMQCIVEVNDYHNVLNLFANPIENFKIDKSDPKVHYFGPGIHEAGVIEVKSDETVFIDGGAVVYGVINSENAQNIKITGRGILDASKIERDAAPLMLNLYRVNKGLVNGIIFRDPHMWTAITGECDSIQINNIKMIGLWRYNADGIDFSNSRNISIRNSFIRSYDDPIVVRGMPDYDNEPYNIIENIEADSCILWCDWGRCLEIGASTAFDTLRNVRFSNIYMPYFTTAAMDIQACDRGYITDIHYENIYIGDPINDSIMLGNLPIVTNAWGKIIVIGLYDSYYATDTVRGNISDISFRNIRYNPSGLKGMYIHEYDSTKVVDDPHNFIRDNMYFGDIRFNSTQPAMIYLSGYDSSHIINNISISGFLMNGNLINDENAIGKNAYVKNVTIK